jgi:hypothetical protein
VLKNSIAFTIQPRIRDSKRRSVVFWPCFELPTAPMTTFSTGCYLPGSPVNKGMRKG